MLLASQIHACILPGSTRGGKTQKQDEGTIVRYQFVPLCGVQVEVRQHWWRCRQDGGTAEESAQHFRLVVSFSLDSEIMRLICTSSFVDSMRASSSILELKSWRTSLPYTLGSGLSKSPLVMLGSVFFVCGMVDSHLLLSLADPVHWSNTV